MTWLPISNAPLTLYIIMNQAIQGASDGKPGYFWIDRVNIIPPGINEDGSPSKAFWSVDMTIMHGMLFIFTCIWLSIYIDMVMPNAYGKGRPFYFCLNCLFRQKDEGKNHSVKKCAKK